jgi:hypothetical protein
MRVSVALALALAALGALLSSCGKANTSASVRTVTVQATTPPGTKAPGRSSGKTQAGRAAALAFAQGVNLRATDVPGFQGSTKGGESSTPAQKRLSRELQQCVGAAANNQPVLELGSESFQRKASIAEVSVSSNVSVQRSAAITGAELKAVRSPHTRSCFTRYFEGIFKGPAYKGATVGRVSLESGTPPAPGTSGSFGWRVRTSLGIRSVNIPVYFDVLGFFYGSSEVTLVSSGLAIPFPAAIEQQLFLLLLSRAKDRHP